MHAVTTEDGHRTVPPVSASIGRRGISYGPDRFLVDEIRISLAQPVERRLMEDALASFRRTIEEAS